MNEKIKDDLVRAMYYYKIINYFKLNDNIANNNLICKNILEEVLKLAKIDLTIIGKENVENINEPFLLASNHRSFFDILLLIVALGKTIPFVTAKKLYGYPVLNRFIKAIDCIAVNPYTTDISELKQQLKQIHNHLNENNLILFPEGECGYLDNEITEFKKGGFLSLNKTKTYIIPTYIHIEKLNKIKRWCVPTGNVTIIFGKSFKSNEINDKKITSAFLSEHTWHKVNELKNCFINNNIKDE